ncbi:MAG TPA: ATPase [Clostridiales bacterium]|jgi:AAA+ superfamily predicted ATPase|nr:ATPase [Clostridiales bacterium]
MATIEQIKSLMRSHFENDNEKFKTIALQIAAHEAKLGHTSSARDIRDIVQNPKYSTKSKIVKLNNRNEMLEEKISDFELRDLVVTESISEKIKRIIKEYQKKELLRKNGLKNRSKFLVTGEPGTGKTMTASVIANELGLTLYVIQLDKLITKYMGETSVKLRQVFDFINEVNAVYLFDEFDAIGSDRSLDNDVGEMRRILNSFLQYLENDDSHSIIIAATNNPDILDKALFRRFDDVFEYKLPDIEQIINLYNMKLKGLAPDNVFTEEVFNASIGLNHSDIVKVCEDSIKNSILEDKEITEEIIMTFIQDRKELYLYKEA